MSSCGLISPATSLLCLECNSLAEHSRTLCIVGLLALSSNDSDRVYTLRNSAHISFISVTYRRQLDHPCSRETDFWAFELLNNSNTSVYLLCSNVPRYASNYSSNLNPRLTLVSYLKHILFFWIFCNLRWSFNGIKPRRLVSYSHLKSQIVVVRCLQSQS